MGGTEKYAADKKLYDDMFQAIRALTIPKFLKIRIFGKKLLQSVSFFSISVKCFDSNYSPRKKYSLIHRTASFVQL